MKWFLRGLPQGIRARLYLLIALTLLPLLILLGWINYQQYETLRSQAIQTQVEVERGIATSFAAYVKGINQQDFAIGQAILVDRASGDLDETRLLTLTAAQSPAVRNLSLVNPGGQVLLSSLADLVGRDLSGRLYFQQILSGQDWAIGDLTPSGIATNAPTFAIATAIRNENRELQSVIVAGIEPTRLGELILTQARPDQGTYSIFDRQGILVYNSQINNPTWEDRTGWKMNDPILQSVLQTGQEQSGVATLEMPVGDWITAEAIVPGLGWVAGAQIPVSVLMASIQQDLIWDVLLALLAGSLALLFAYFLARTISRPLYRLERDAAKMVAGQFEPVSDPIAPVEVLHLRSSVETMAVALIHQAEISRESEEHYRTLFDNRHTPMLVIDPVSGQIVEANPAASSFYGWERSELLAKKITDINTLSAEQTQQKMAEAQASATKKHFFFRHRLANGEIRDVEVHSGPIRISGKEYLFSIIEDITERKLAEQSIIENEARLADIAERLKRSNQDLEQFAFIASHDMQEPLRKIIAFGEVIAQRIGTSLDAESADYIRRMQNAAQRMEVMIQDLLELSRVNVHGKAFQKVDLSIIASEVVSDLEQRINHERGQVIIESLPVIDADPNQMQRLLQNLIGNALKYHRVDIPPVVKVTCAPGDLKDRNLTGVTLLVEDNGIGFEEQFTDRIFQPFQRLHGRSEYEGTGMGLAICKKIVERHHGSITAHSKPGEGSTFIVTLPLKQPE